MKSRSREINVFSMSALDLFASALGAFILISIVLMPYFLRVEPDEVQRLRRALTEARAALTEAERENARTERENARLQQELQALLDAPKVSFPNLDLVIALDTTNSMKDVVSGLRYEIDQFARLMLELTPALGMGVIDFKDRCDGSDAVREFPLRLVSSAGVSSLRSFTRSIIAGSASCNRDGPEALHMALDAAIASNWRAESEARIVVVITDNPAYPERQAHAISAARAFVARGPQHKVSTVHEPTGKSDPGTAEFLRRLAEAGNGNFTGGGGSFTATILLALAGL